MYVSGYQRNNIASRACSSQFAGKLRNLGSYELKEDAARAFDKVARILGVRDVNFPNSDALEINGPRSNPATKTNRVFAKHCN